MMSGDNSEQWREYNGELMQGVMVSWWRGDNDVDEGEIMTT